MTAFAGELAARKGRPSSPPNVVLILSDEHQFNALGCYGSAKLADPAATAATSYYWLVGVQKLERAWNKSEIYAGVPVATRELCQNLPASMRMKIPNKDSALKFSYTKQNLYD